MGKRTSSQGIWPWMNGMIYDGDDNDADDDERRESVKDSVVAARAQITWHFREYHASDPMLVWLHRHWGTPWPWRIRRVAR